MGRLSHRQGIGVIAITLFVVLLVGVTALRRGLSPGGSSRVTLRETGSPAASVSPPSRPVSPSPPVVSHTPFATVVSPADAPVAPSAAPPLEVVVHVAGAVKKPGVYHLAAGSRNDDAVKAAGGPSSKANLDAVNLAARLEDGTQLYIPTHQEQPTGGATGQSAPLTVASSIRTPADGRSEHPASRRSRKGSGKSGKGTKLSDPGQGQININTATADELQRVPGIGPTMAERILAYRQENHSFQSVDDLLQVSGIGESKFARMQPFLKVR